MRNILALSCASAMLLTACSTAGKKEVSSSSSSKSLALESKYPDPGPFKLVTNSDGEELWQSRGETGKRGGTFTVSTFGSGPKTFNPWAAADVESDGIGYLMFEHLVDTDAWTGKPYGRLAKSIEISPDKKDYVITLRKGLTWSDGKPITADDVVFTMNTLIGKGFGNSSRRDVLSVYGKFPTTTKVDDLTVKIHTDVPFVPFLNSLSGVPIGPKHIVEPITKKNMKEFQSFWDVNCDPKTLVTSGRFKLLRYVPGQRAEFLRNEKYGMVDKEGTRLPYLDKFVYAIVPDQNTQILKFYAGELDLLDIRSVKGPDAALMKQREKTGNFTMHGLGPDDGTMFIMFNMNRRKDPESGKYYVDPIKQKWFNNLNFRQAVSHALNRQRIVNNVLRGVGLPLYTAESEASPFLNKDLKQYPQDLDLAANLLKQGGFVKKADGLYDADGHKVEFSLLTNSGNIIRDAVCIIIMDELKKLGIKVNYQPIDFNILISKADHSLDWEAIVMGLTGPRIEPYDGANVWKSDGRLHMFDQRKPDSTGKVIVPDRRDWEAKIDELFDKMATTFDETKRHEYCNEYQAIVYEQQPFIYLYTPLLLTSIKNSVGNYKPLPLGINYTPLGSMHNLEEIYFYSNQPKGAN
ncbi:MAG: ABC transporter substrate-binding protein [Candidatus Obscuribacterales bacterium]|nr:ABC transporter substrate-binding protein [Candidatus Obscuribacterales bacterium]